MFQSGLFFIDGMHDGPGQREERDPCCAPASTDRNWRMRPFGGILEPAVDDLHFEFNDLVRACIRHPEHERLTALERSDHGFIAIDDLRGRP